MNTYNNISQTTNTSKMKMLVRYFNKNDVERRVMDLTVSEDEGASRRHQQIKDDMTVLGIRRRGRLKKTPTDQGRHDSTGYQKTRAPQEDTNRSRTT